MEKIKQSLKLYTQQTGVTFSILVTIVSLLLLVIAILGNEFRNTQLETFCVFSLIFEFIYGIVLCFKILKNKIKYKHLIPFLFLNWFIGCFCTNIFINIFENLPIWVYLVTFLFCLTNFFIYSNYKHKYITPLSYFCNGFSFLLILYYVVYLIPFTPFSFIGILALGMGFYGLVPLIVFTSHSVILIKKYTSEKTNFNYFAVGISIVLIGFTIFTYLLNKESQKIESKSISKSFNVTNNDLPTYITLSQNLKPNFLNEILLKKDIVYICTDNFFEFRGLESIGSKQYNERKIHNPLINMALLFSSNLDLSADDRISILKSNFNKRLETEEHLWSGEDLITKNIKEDIKIYANDRLAYTEITMDIACEKDSWGEKEAIYSFQLPEGSVATSLSLWVNGIERKGVLTTKEKAQNAYKQIVGVEYRDPSLMQWKEGNKVVVRVFPVSEKLPRTFKCGFTTPLKIENNQMKYQSLDIKGPNIASAETISRIQMVGNKKFEATKDFVLKNNFYTNESEGLDQWEAVMPLNTDVFSNAFVWKDKVYKIKEIEKQTIAFIPSEIVLDLNSSWTEEELNQILNLKNKKYFVNIDNQKEEINKTNSDLIFSQFEELQYSLLPLYKVAENCLVITKCNTFSANFEELETSNYLKKIKSRTKERHIKVINIANEINPFWQTIKEQKYVEYLKIDLKTSLKLIQENQYFTQNSAENLVTIEPANIAIEEKIKTATSKSNGSNHIYRMYAFGKVLEEQVKIQQDSLAKNKYVDLAKDANIVTPISSLVVLETEEDYKKNGVEKNVNTLGNASINNDGSVPEPHEWLMILLALIGLGLYYKKSKKQVL